MIINYDKNRLSEALQNFYNATGINLALVKEDFSPFCDNNRTPNSYCGRIHSSRQGKNACKCSDIKLLEKCRQTGTSQTHICHAGLMDVGIPIIYGKDILGYIILGQMKHDGDFEPLKEYIGKLGLDPLEMKQYYDALPFFEHDRIRSIAEIAGMLAKHLLLENLLRPSSNANIEKAEIFIGENLSKNLSVKYISKSIGVSKSVLYKNFRESFDCTISEYINQKRIEKACELLEHSNLSVEEISQKTGFSSSSYFTRMFKKYKGIAPLRYRKAQSI